MPEAGPCLEYADLLDLTHHALHGTPRPEPPATPLQTPMIPSRPRQRASAAEKPCVPRN
ncbi:hypothetical protein BCR43DRAFT_498609 [Syncephalastrum racemosum]|uniref:Uncharacterized protein n=1 Tax=Syncephalastrum racemosum TaxID=13706 RepID=A0A1X2H164_SYNRA|nr:hypothetical protein BCR43DRAFT_498609 [Syncephalastrum racemosum]